MVQEIDLAYCEQAGIPVFRREVGGGGVYLDGQQLFYQLVIRQGNPLVPTGKEAFYRKFLHPVVETYRAIGIAAHYKPINDVLTEEGRKISGNGVAEIAGHIVFVGNLIVDFDYATMVRVLKVPDEKFRDRVFKSLQENLTTIRRELGQVPPLEELKATLLTNFNRVLGDLSPAELEPPVEDKVAELAQELTTEEWLFQRGRRVEGREVGIATGVEVRERVYKATGGLIRGTVETKDSQIVSAYLSGDFFFYPAEKLTALERALVGVSQDEVEEAVARFYREEGVESPGVTPADFAQVLG